MANGMHCRHCGYQESDHIYGWGDRYERLKGYRQYPFAERSKERCNGFELSKREARLNSAIEKGLAEQESWAGFVHGEHQRMGALMFPVLVEGLVSRR